MSSRPRSEHRRTKEELRRLLITAGTQLLIEEGLGTGAEALTFKRVYERLARSTGVRVTNSSVIGRIWDSQADFQVDVLSTFARESGSSAVDETLAAGAKVLAHSDRSSLERRRQAMVEALRLAAAAHIQAVSKAETWPSWVGVWALTTAGTGPDSALGSVRDALVAGYEHVTARYEEQYAGLLDYCGFRVRPPLTVHELTVAAGALAEGLVLQERVAVGGLGTVDRPTGREGTPQQWTLFGIALVALVGNSSSPIPNGTGTGGEIRQRRSEAPRHGCRFVAPRSRRDASPRRVSSKVLNPAEGWSKRPSTMTSRRGGSSGRASPRPPGAMARESAPGAELGLASGPAPISGRCEARFAAVREAFAANFTEQGEVGAAVTVYQAGEPVVELAGGWKDDRHTEPWQHDTLVNVYSVGKPIVSLLLLQLVDTGDVGLDDPVASIWPDFAASTRRR